MKAYFMLLLFQRNLCAQMLSQPAAARYSMFIVLGLCVPAAAGTHKPSTSSDFRCDQRAMRCVSLRVACNMDIDIASDIRQDDRDEAYGATSSCHLVILSTYYATSTAVPRSAEA